MFRKAYDFIRSILNEKQVDDYILTLTNKHLAVLDAGAKVTVPSAQISFAEGRSSRRANTAVEVAFNVDFALPFWGNDAFAQCLGFVDFIVPALFDYREQFAFVSHVASNILEPEELSSQIWHVLLSISISILV